ncbi:hypothetical protein GUJ93_ZPchr0006g42182 [Zizania palustris]|uniref:Uncharacterized protein n=1 Tax=Zizania palustris TaxID=103762 RepID=A0A8J5SZC3_ZIZPA|nr:hypothetical protein GUJ93_ZPchr0006g42182 [Zizania palustris]
MPCLLVRGSEQQSSALLSYPSVIAHRTRHSHVYFPHWSRRNIVQANTFRCMANNYHLLLPLQALQYGTVLPKYKTTMLCSNLSMGSLCQGTCHEYCVN